MGGRRRKESMRRDEGWASDSWQDAAYINITYWFRYIDKAFGGSGVRCRDPFNHVIRY